MPPITIRRPSDAPCPVRRDPLSPGGQGLTQLTPAEQASACAALCEHRVAKSMQPKLNERKRREYRRRAYHHAERCAQLRPLFDGDDEAIAAALDRCGAALNLLKSAQPNSTRQGS